MVNNSSSKNGIELDKNKLIKFNNFGFWRLRYFVRLLVSEYLLILNIASVTKIIYQLKLNGWMGNVALTIKQSNHEYIPKSPNERRFAKFSEFSKSYFLRFNKSDALSTFRSRLNHPTIKKTRLQNYKPEFPKKAIRVYKK